MEDQIGTVQIGTVGVIRRNPNKQKSKVEVIRRNLDRIHISDAAPPPSNLSRNSQVSLI